MFPGGMLDLPPPASTEACSPPLPEARLTRRHLLLGACASSAFALLPAPARAIIASPAAFDLTPDGATDSAAGIMQAITEAARTGRSLVFPPGVYAYDSRHIELSGLSAVAVSCEPGVVFRDRGRMVTGPDGRSFQLPWGFVFRDCPGDIRWSGGVFESLGETLRGRSGGSFDASNVELRKPVFGFDHCGGRVRVSGIGHRGSPGRGIAGVDQPAILDALGLRPTPNEFAAFAGNGAFFFAYGCPDVRRDDCHLVADTCAREQVIFVGCSGAWRNERSWSTGQNMYSLGKVIGCRDFSLGGFRIRDTTTSSIVDIIGDDIAFTDSFLDCPNSKACDVSHEWGAANQPSSNIRIARIHSTGRGVVNATVKSTPEQVAAAPITGVVISDCRFNVGRTDFTKDVSLQLRGVADVTIERMRFENESPCGYAHRGDGGRSIRVHDCAMAWTLPADMLDNNNRQFLATALNEYERCTIVANASRAAHGGGLARLPFTGGGIGGRHVLRGGAITDTHLLATDGAVVELHGVALSRTTWEAVEGSFALYGCTVEGVPLPDSSPG
jgi:coenzyme F420-reducing hydrogenase delta subunit